MPSDEHLLDQIEATYPELERWRATVASGFAPEAGTELAGDDEHWPQWPLSEMASVGLGVAFDHLDAIRRTIDARRLFPFAQATLVRAGLIGAAQSVWLLAPEESAERLARFRSLVADVYEQHGKYLEVLRGSAPDHVETGLVADHAKRRQTELTELREGLGERTRFQSTNMILTAARSVLLPPFVRNVEAIWRSTSGAAHGQPWTILGGSDTSQVGPADEHGRANFVSAGSVSRIANAYLCVFELTRHGWGLREMRGTSRS